MARFRLLLVNEFKLFHTAIPIHLVAILQPTVMYLLLTVILVHPTFDIYVDRPATEDGRALVSAMREVGSPIGAPYINPVLIDWDGASVSRQVIAVEERDGVTTAVQHYGLIDSNLVKNFRNRLTAAALRLWNADLGARAVTVDEYAWLPQDVPYTVYFGMALLPMTAFLAASVMGAILTAQEFELRTIVEYQLAPASVVLVLGARLARLVLSALIAAGILLVTVGLVTDYWPGSPLLVALILLPVAVIAGCLGVLAGLLMRKSIPAFLVGLVGSFVGWVLGSGFGLAAGFGSAYELISRATPFTHATELLFSLYYGADISHRLVSILYLTLASLVMMVLAGLAYHWRVMRQD